MIKKIVFYISIISFVLLAILVFEMLPFIYESGFCGILFLIFIIITFICELFMLIFNKRLIKKSFLNNIFIIIAVMYVSFLYYNIYSSSNNLYDASINYLKNNYFVLSMLFLFIILDMIINLVYDKKKL